MRLLLTITLALVTSAAAGFVALVVCSLQGQPQASLSMGALVAIPAMLVSLIAFCIAASRQRALPAVTRTQRWLIVASLAPLVAMRLGEMIGSRPTWAMDWSEGADVVMMVVCVAVVISQWGVFRWYASRSSPPSPPIRFGRSTER